MSEAQASFFAGGDNHTHVIYDDNVTIGYGSKLVTGESGEVLISEDKDAFRLPVFDSMDDIY